MIIACIIIHKDEDFITKYWTNKHITIGIWYSSFRVTRLKLSKYIHTFNLPLFFFITRTMFGIRSSYLIGLVNLAFKSYFISSSTWSIIFGAILCEWCLYDLNTILIGNVLIGNECSTKLLSKLDISS
jgi:hypothetical protein